ncbi:hypothetical protein FRACYDRAFT_246633 [Fragilariopsis cylindrus CCMP1102]|uniref:Uncharacterized protein n=1 Tax=Fragilariopsis cylindrus CCMP1102 TaxID=635003 RepID=A0A1E7EY61_9STRA|nr:hypothetical protein FRACYDRAFT_246633 [Fragilariopsis cylindrus CCMP1102]|eukprot:OEU10766.1 hypothetical protein FRACYDRAFT_246633 [Fragilariopsis cylindrus CCMP1102]
MTFLDKNVCVCCCFCYPSNKGAGAGSTPMILTIGDLFKLIIPIGWSMVAFAAFLAYIISPIVTRGDTPRWGSAILVLFNSLSAIGLSICIYNFHRKTSSYGIEDECDSDNDSNNNENDNEDGGQQQQQQQQQQDVTKQRRSQWIQFIRIHTILSILFCFISIILIIFFGIFASNLNMCAHVSCGADVGWSCITLGISIVWLFITYLGYKSYSKITSSTHTNNGSGNNNNNTENENENEAGLEL